MRSAIVTFAVVLSASVPGARASQDLDEQRSPWRYRRSVRVMGEGAFAAVVIPPEVAARGQADLRDLRLVGPDGTEVPYVVDRVVDRTTTRIWVGRLVDARREPIGPAEEGRGRGIWSVDLGEARTFDTVTLQIAAQDFTKRVRLEASADRDAWRLLRDDAGLFDAPWSPRVHHTAIALAAPERARYLRLTMNDNRRSPPVDITGVTVRTTRRAEGEEWTQVVGLDGPERKMGTSRYRLDLPVAFPFERLDFEADDAAFARNVRLLEIRTTAGRAQERVLAEGLLYRVKLPDPELAGECLSLALASTAQAGDLFLEVQDGDSPPLKRPRLTISGVAVRLLFAGTAGPLTLYYGNDLTRAPLYDLGPARGRLALSDLAVTLLGPEAENPRFRRAAPLPFAPLRGAPVEVQRWKSVRRLASVAREDLYQLTLAPEDLASLRPDLGDLRIVDEEGRQVPYVLEAGVADTRVGLAIERASRPQRADGRTVSRTRLSLETTSRKPMALPLAALELEIREAFFDRPVRLLVAAPDGRGERPIFSGRLVRRVDPRPSADDPVILTLDGSRLQEMTLEVDEGDNAPLSVASARALVRVPRVTFKIGPGSYRLLLGNGDATPPRYDLASLRKEVLAYSALAATASPAQANPAFRRFAADYFGEAPPLLLWGTLVVAVAILLLLTARALRERPE